MIELFERESVDDSRQSSMEEPYYPEDVKRRVKKILLDRRRKYQYLYVAWCKTGFQL